MDTLQSIDLISTNPDMRGGRPCLAGTGIEVGAIVMEHLFQSRDPGQIAADYQVPLAQIYAALAYYYEHKDEMDAVIRERSHLAETYREQRIGSRHPPLFG